MTRLLELLMESIVEPNTFRSTSPIPSIAPSRLRKKLSAIAWLRETLFILEARTTWPSIRLIVDRKVVKIVTIVASPFFAARHRPRRHCDKARPVFCYVSRNFVHGGTSPAAMLNFSRGHGDLPAARWSMSFNQVKSEKERERESLELVEQDRDGSVFFKGRETLAGNVEYVRGAFETKDEKVCFGNALCLESDTIYTEKSTHRFSRSEVRIILFFIYIYIYLYMK